MGNDTEISELALEIIDMLGVALYFAGAKREKIRQLIDCYMDELECADDHLPYNQEQMIELIKTLRVKHPQYFRTKKK